MSKDIKVKKGLNLRFKGEAEQTLVEAPKSKTFAIKPPDFHGVVPKLVLREGAKVQAGEIIFYSKYNDTVKFSSPVSGTIKEVLRGAKRRVLEIIIEADAVNSYKEFGVMNVDNSDADTVKARVFESGCGAFIKQRPYDILADPDDAPKAIYVSAYNSAPLAANAEFILQDQKEDFQEGLKALKKLTAGKVYVAVNGKSSKLKDLQGVEILNVSGPHPAGNVGVHVQETEPMNMGDRVWVVGPEDVAIIGRLFLTGRYDAKRTIAVVGADAKDRKYFKTYLGANVTDLVGEVNESETRIISGDVLTGLKLSNHQYVGFYDNTVSVIPEGNNYRMFGWLPFTYNNIHSMSKTSLSWMFPNKKYDVNTNLNGEERALVVTGEMEEVMPLDVYPMQLLKACMTGNIEKMENLGIYEVIPEDFALIDYVNTSKVEAQEIIRLGLDLMITEVG
ncbi:Na(+)-translocating NADH-quinone reductase subunit A [Mesonia aestuariivivens]|uniref:Na(+)-translocating NADH-quinone reductase subunit A n=1 Tax=Mesonia aestuariivivens TaxID=2796128 RepID=A0ABS6W1A7_9FLAO|nr:Na(+)-translocating NADH-quinone reductase subunit A [Mesonia aestuariivivens]MBW2960943.1 Na(+)-translocating NADH-quinone reductase subunit A [Mesonia aestuariivivens]